MIKPLSSFCLLLIVSLPAFAEVSDKVQTYETMWLVCAIATLVCCALTWLRSYLIGIAIIWTLLSAYGYYDMSSDGYFAPLVMAEMGDGYFLAGYIASFLVTIAVAAVVFYKSRTKA